MSAASTSTAQRLACTMRSCQPAGIPSPTVSASSASAAVTRGSSRHPAIVPTASITATAIALEPASPTDRGIVDDHSTATAGSGRSAWDWRARSAAVTISCPGGWPRAATSAATSPGATHSTTPPSAVLRRNPSPIGVTVTLAAHTSTTAASTAPPNPSDGLPTRPARAGTRELVGPDDATTSSVGEDDGRRW
jgi:hypothetical protein